MTTRVVVTAPREVRLEITSTVRFERVQWVEDAGATGINIQCELDGKTVCVGFASGESRLASTWIQYLVRLHEEVDTQAGLVLKLLAERGEQAMTDLERDKFEKVSARTAQMYEPGTTVLRHGVFRERAALEFTRAADSNRSVFLALIDVDDFAAINQKVGAREADGFLISIGQTIQSILPTGEVYPPSVGREPGDSLGVVVPGLEEEAAGILSEKMVVGMEKFPFRGATLTVSLAGCCGVPARDVDPHALFQALRAETRALFELGGNRCSTRSHAALTRMFGKGDEGDSGAR